MTSSLKLNLLTNCLNLLGRALSLRVPLTRLISTTYAYYPDETHGAIRRVFTPNHAPQTKRHFCGFCGTPLSYWSEESPEEAEWICVNLSSLKSDSLEWLEDTGFLSDAGKDHEEKPEAVGEEPRDSREVAASGHGREVRGTPWFEEMIEGSELGRIKRMRGGESSADGKTTVEWEITEFESNEGDGGTTGTGKRKHGSLGDGNDVEMKSG